MRKIFAIAVLALTLITSNCNRLNNFDLNLEPQVNTRSGENEIIIKRNLSESTSLSKSKIYSTAQKIKNLHSIGVEVLKIPDGVSIQSALEDLRANSDIEYAEPNYKRKMALVENPDKNNSETKIMSNDKIKAFSASTFFNDPDIKLQYALENMEAEKAWKINTGSENIIIAVVDTGADLNHPDLKDNLVNGYTAINGTDSPNDDNGHGTHVSGIIAAIANNQRGIAGLAPNCKVMPIKVLSGKGEGVDSDIAEGIVWAVDHGAKIINMSLGGPEEGKTLDNALKYAFNSNVLVVSSMGNDGKKIKNYPASYKNVIAVGATNQKNDLASFSNTGEWISVVAPGYKIHSTFPTYKVDLSRLNLPNNYASLSGTSMSSPYVAALAGLIWSKNPSMSRADVRKKLEKSTYDLGSKGFDENFGTGLVSAYKALSN